MKTKQDSLSKNTKQFVMWFQSLDTETREIAIALIIANCPESGLLRVKTLLENNINLTAAFTNLKSLDKEGRISM